MGSVLKFPIAGSSCQPPGREETGLKGLNIGFSTRKALRDAEAE